MISYSTVCKHCLAVGATRKSKAGSKCLGIKDKSFKSGGVAMADHCPLLPSSPVVWLQLPHRYWPAHGTPQGRAPGALEIGTREQAQATGGAGSPAWHWARLALPCRGCCQLFVALPNLSCWSWKCPCHVSAHSWFPLLLKVQIERFGCLRKWDGGE